MDEMNDRIAEGLRIDVTPPAVDDVRRRGRQRRGRRRALTGVAALAGAAAVVVALAVAAPSTDGESERVDLDGGTDLAAAVAAGAFADGFTLLAYLEPTADPEAIAGVDAVLAAAPEVADVVYVDQAAAYEEYRALFADRPELIDAVEPADMPPSFRVRLDAGCGDELTAALDAMPGMYRVVRSPTAC